METGSPEVGGPHERLDPEGVTLGEKCGAQGTTLLSQVPAVLVPATQWWLLFGSSLTGEGQSSFIVHLGFLEVSRSRPSCELSVLLGKAPF